MKKTAAALMLLASVAVSVPALAAEPSLHEVYQAADSGKLIEAQNMMHEVLKAHPNSGKAHYVEAELLAKQGQLKPAASELATAEKLAPGLPFASATSVAGLREVIDHQGAAPVQGQHVPLAAPPATGAPGLPWGMIFMGLGLVAFIVWATRFMASRNAAQGALAGAAQAGVGGYRPAYPSSPYGGAPQGYGGPGVAPAAGGSGLGSQVMSGLATGAAIGAGVAAGEALIHHFTDGHSSAPNRDHGFSNYDSNSVLPSTPFDDMGGNDFGVSDSGSWDDGGSGGDSDWN